MIKEYINLIKIIEVAGEGGSISILGKKEMDTLEYTIKINESTLMEYFDEGYNETRGKEIENNWIRNWDDIFTRFCNYPIARFYPIHIDSQYVVRIWSKLKELYNGTIPRRWLQKLKENSTDILTLANMIKDSNYTVVLTGAGMSTESGIPDFRSVNGIWKDINPMKIATQDTLISNYDYFHEFYSQRLDNIKGRKPHIGYEILANWESEGLIASIITQNVDDFHLLAGSKNVLRLHGSLNEFFCNNCATTYDKQLFINKASCKKCEGNLRPSVVLFGESLPEESLNKAISQMEKAELVIIIGTSLEVYPVNQLPNLTNSKVVYINKNIRDSQYFYLMFSENVGEILNVLDYIISK